MLDKIKETAKANNQISLLVQVLFLEKKIESITHYTKHERQGRQLIDEANDVNERLLRITQLSNLALQLYSWYINNGHARNEKDEQRNRKLFSNLPVR